MEEMYKQALLDAKAVRASAMANAKASLQEAFEPKIQEMIRLKLSEELEDGLEEDENDPYSEKISKRDLGTQDEESWETSAEDTAYKMGIHPEKTGGSLAEDEEEMDEDSLEEILAELDALSEESEEDEEKDMVKEEEDEEAQDDEEKDEDETDAEEASGEEGMEEVPTDDTKVIDITLGDLKAVLQSIQGDEMPADEAGEESTETSDDEDINLDEILAGLEEAKMKGTDKKKMEEKKVKDEETKKSLEEAKKTINVLRKELNEVNLLNAKLLYMNKIFKSKNLSESQKVGVVTALDRASNVKEAKNIYETLKESLTSKKSQIQESKGFASKPAGVAPKTPIVEADAFVSRWQKIAGIK